MSHPDQSSPRGLLQKVVAVSFGLLSVGFLFRFLQFGFNWLRHVVEPDTNFKALAVWSLIYTVICATIAAVVYRLPSTRGDEPAQNGERGT